MLFTANRSCKIGIIGLGYIGLPLAIAFSEKYTVYGFDIDDSRIQSLKNGVDTTLQATPNELKKSNIIFTPTLVDLKDCSIYIITVPTPVDEFKKPDLGALLLASETVGRILKKGDIVIYESTVYPGCTEEECIPILEKTSKLIYNSDFFCGYSPERLSPGDALHSFKKIVKVTSGSTPEVANFIDDLYSEIVDAGTYKAPSIKVAEAAKAIENAQRDVNISFVNELALIFDRMDIDTNDVIEAAATKWNFLKFKPGLVGGHCIGVDPYYLAYKSESLGYQPEVILSGRRVNDSMGIFVINKLVKLMLAKGSFIKKSRVLILGITFKENCPDIRNSRVMDIYNESEQFGMQPEIYDPWADPIQVKKLYHLNLVQNIYQNSYQAIVLAVAHDEFLKLDFSQLKKTDTVLFDTKSVIDRKWVDARL